MESQFTISGIVVIVWLIFPGIIFKRFYYQGQFTKQFGIGPFADRIITSIFWGIFVQIITFLIYSRSFGFTFTGIKNVSFKVYRQLSKNELPDLTYEHLGYILGYLVFLIIVAALLGTIVHKFIRILKIDVKFEVFRFSNQWNYYFRGEILSTRDFKGHKKGRILSTLVDVLIDDATDKNKMVSGFLTQYTISPKTGELETIYLTSAQRYSKTNNQFKTIPGDCLIIPYERIIDLNIRYNIQVIDINQRKQSLLGLISLISLIVAFFLLIFPWYLHVSITRKSIGVILILGWWTSFTALVLNPFQTKDAKLDKMGFITITILMLIFLCATLFVLRILSF